MNNDNTNLFNNNANQDFFKQFDEEKKKEEPTEMTNDEFIKNLPDWDLPPLYEKVRRVNRQ